MSAPTTDAPRERRNSTVVSPMPDETPVHWISMLAVYFRIRGLSQTLIMNILVLMDYVPVTITTLPFKAVNSSSLIVNSVMFD